MPDFNLTNDEQAVVVQILKDYFTDSEARSRRRTTANIGMILKPKSPFSKGH